MTHTYEMLPADDPRRMEIERGIERVNRMEQLAEQDRDAMRLVLSADEQQLLVGLYEHDDGWVRNDRGSVALREKLHGRGLEMCWPCQGSGQTNVQRETQSSERCELCEGKGFCTNRMARLGRRRK